jgi:hypothetical protein
MCVTILQNYNCHTEGAIYRSLSPEQQQAGRCPVVYHLCRALVGDLPPYAFKPDLRRCSNACVLKEICRRWGTSAERGHEALHAASGRVLQRVGCAAEWLQVGGCGCCSCPVPQQFPPALASPSELETIPSSTGQHGRRPRHSVHQQPPSMPPFLPLPSLLWRRNETCTSTAGCVCCRIPFSCLACPLQGSRGGGHVHRDPIAHRRWA